MKEFIIFLLGWCIGIWNVIIIQLIVEKVEKIIIANDENEGEENEI